MTSAARDPAWGGSGGGSPPTVPPESSLEDFTVVGDFLVRGGEPHYDARAFSPGPWDGVSDNYAAVQSIVDAIPYGIILLPPLVYLSQRVLIENKTILVRSQYPSNPFNFGSLVKVAAGQTAFEIRNGINGRGARSVIEGLHLLGSDSAPGTNPGIKLSANAGAVRDCVVESFGGDGIHVRSGQVADPFVVDGSYNANTWRVDRVRCYNNKGHGFHAEGIDSNAGLATLLDCTGNTGSGIFDDSSFGNTYVGPHLDGNLAAAIRVGGHCRGIRAYSVYKEGNANPAVLLDAAVAGAAVGGNLIDFRTYVGNAGETITDNTAMGDNVILTPNGFLKQNRLMLGAVGPTGTAAAIDIEGAFGGAIFFGGDLSFSRAAANVLALNNAIEMPERADPAAPAANNARLYVKDNGAGKTQLVVRFPTGAVQVIATEP